ncbi:MAG: T9SS type A sorting domain-containing protein [Bacteroidota bacterium]
MKINLLLLFACFCLGAQAQNQTFSYAGTLPTPIPDNNANAYYPIAVSGLPAQMNAGFGLASVCFSIDHPQPSDLKISLSSPDGNSIILSLHNGNGGSNYTSTCLRMDAPTSMTSEIAPFTGTFMPDQSLNYLNNGQNPNGIWTATIIDVFPFFNGSLDDISLNFGNNPPPDPSSLQLVCTTTNSAGCMCKDTSLGDCDLLPDLLCSHVVIRDGYNETTGHIGFPNTVINIGGGPIEMKPTGNCFCDTVPVTCATVLCPDSTLPKEGIVQRIYHKAPNGQMTYYDRPAGYQSFHPAHNHVHVQDFTAFSLRVPTGDPNPINWPVITNSIKQGYCLINMGSCNSIDSVCVTHGNVVTDNMIPNFNLGIVTGCGAQGQGVFVGRYDMYGAGNGQEITAPNICNGNYYIVAIIDPFNNFIEEDETNNVVAIPVTLTQQTGAALNASFVYVTSGQQVGFINYTPNVTQTWDFGDGSAAGTGIAPSHTYSLPGVYIVTLTVFNGTCATTSAQTITVGVVSGMESYQSGLFEVTVNPNPSRDKFNVEYQLVNPSEVTVTVYNVIGEEVKSFPTENQLSGKHVVELEGLSKGAYMVKVNANDKSIVKRIVKL